MKKKNQTQVLVVGAGPVGLALVNQLATLGIDFRIIDQKLERSNTFKATGLQYRVSEILDCMGISEEFISKGISPTGVKIYEGKKTLTSFNFSVAGRPAGVGAFQPEAIVIPQSKTEAILEDTLNKVGHDVSWNTKLVSYEQQGEQVVSVIENSQGKKEKIISDWLISCEGAHSAIRKQEGMEFDGNTGSVKFLLADVQLKNCTLNKEENHLWLHADGTFGMLPLPGEDNWRLTFEVSKKPEYFVDEPSLDLVRSLASQRGGVDPQMIHNPHFITKFGVNFRMVEDFRKGRVFLAGDAAHIHSPTGAMGIVNGIQDATNLAWKLSRVIQDGAALELLDTYSQERVPRVKEVLTEIDRNTRSFFATNPVQKFIRNNVIFPLLNTKAFQKKMFSRSSQLTVRYADSPLSRLETPAPKKYKGIQSGERAPDINFQTSEQGKSKTLYSTLRSHTPVVLLGEDYAFANHKRTQSLMEALEKLNIQSYVVTRDTSSARELEDKCLVDESRSFERIYGLQKDFLCVIRPDIHVGLIQNPVNLNLLQKYVMNLNEQTQVQNTFAAIN